jgi:hypothetical protein
VEYHPRVEPSYKFGDFGGVLAMGVRECRGSVVTELIKKTVVYLPGIYTTCMVTGVWKHLLYF